MNEDISDNDLKKLLDNNLPEAPRSEWFIPKVMNRLPEKRPKQYKWIDYATYIIATALYVYFWIDLAQSVYGTNMVTLSQIATATVLVAIGLGITIASIAPHVRRWLKGF